MPQQTTAIGHLLWGAAYREGCTQDCIAAAKVESLDCKCKCTEHRVGTQASTKVKLKESNAAAGSANLHVEGAGPSQTCAPVPETQNGVADQDTEGDNKELQDVDDHGDVVMCNDKKGKKKTCHA